MPYFGIGMRTAPRRSRKWRRMQKRPSNFNGTTRCAYTSPFDGNNNSAQTQKRMKNSQERTIDCKNEAKEAKWKFVFFYFGLFLRFSSLLFSVPCARTVCARSTQRTSHLRRFSFWWLLESYMQYAYAFVYGFSMPGSDLIDLVLFHVQKRFIFIYFIRLFFVLFCLFSFRWIFPLKFDAHTHVQSERRRRTCIPFCDESTLHWVARCDRQPVTTVRRTISNAGRFISVFRGNFHPFGSI